MPTEYPAWREADSGGSNPGVEAPWIEPASRSTSEPDSASLRKSRTANLSEMPKPDTCREEIFTNSGGVLRGGWGQRVGKVELGRLGDPCRRFREERNKRRVKSIRRDLMARESERPIVAKKRGNARGAKGPWSCGTNSEADAADWRNPTTACARWAESAVAGRSQIAFGGECPAQSAWRKPDAGNPHIRFDEGEGSQRSKDASRHSVTSFSTLPPFCGNFPTPFAPWRLRVSPFLSFPSFRIGPLTDPH